MTADLAPSTIRLDEGLFARIASRVHADTGIVLKPHKRQMVASRLARRLKARGIGDPGTYLDLLERPEEGNERIEFVNAITTNLTSFFREAHHFDDLASVVLPQLSGRIRIWSAGCSTGEEVWSTLITIARAAGGRLPPDLLVLATDIDTRVLSIAKAARYPTERLASMPTEATRWLRRDGGSVTVDATLRDRVRFRRLNLLDPWPMAGHFDVIFCRNVLIYFSAETKAGLIDRFAAQLKPGGTLYLGHSESLLREHALLASAGRTIYRRRTA
ncbi:MAG: CheR family methyltransferase [Rubricella sp.]